MIETKQPLNIPPGAKKDQLDKFYRMFKRLHKHRAGSGVGLYRIKRIIERHGGSIAVESKAGEGTRFLVNLTGHAQPVTA